MTVDEGPRENFGCERCWPPAAEAAWDARRELGHVAELVDESHFGVSILECPRCGQRFLSVFTEMIDWGDGEDPQYWKVLPLTAEEAAELIQHPDRLGGTRLQELGSGRRCLRREWPKGEAKRTFWATGIWIEPHD